MESLATVLDSEGYKAEAEQAFREALAADQRVFGTNSPLTTNTMTNFAETLTEEGKLAEADPLMRNALKIRLQTLGPVHPDTALQSRTAVCSLTFPVAVRTGLAHRLGVGEGSTVTNDPGISPMYNPDEGTVIQYGLRRRSDRNKPAADPQCDRFGAGGGTELVENRADVELDSVFGDTEPRRDILVDKSLR